MISMELTHADNLKPDQLMLGDLIKIGDDIVEIILLKVIQREITMTFKLKTNLVKEK